MTENRVDPEKAKPVVVLLSRLAIHYYRPDFDEARAKLLIQDYVRDLADYAVEDIARGVQGWRQNPKAKFFPSIGELLLEVKKAQGERIDRDRPRAQFKGTRPILWWAQPKQLWSTYWREIEVPIGEKIRDGVGTKLRDPERVVF